MMDRVFITEWIQVQKEKGATASLLRKVTTVDLTELYGRNRGSR